MKKLLLLPLLLMGLAGQAYGSNDSVDKMFEVMDMERQMNGGFEAMLPLIDQMAAQFRLDATGKEELTTIYRTWFNDDIDRDKMINTIKDLYAETFTEQEIDAITAFYRTDVGQKFLGKQPELMQIGAQLGMTEAQSKQAQLLERLQPFLEKYNIQ